MTQFTGSSEIAKRLFNLLNGKIKIEGSQLKNAKLMPTRKCLITFHGNVFKIVTAPLVKTFKGIIIDYSKEIEIHWIDYMKS